MIKNFNELIKKDICIAFFHASWCGDCKILSKTIDNLKDKLNIIDIDTDEDKIFEIINNITEE